MSGSPRFCILRDWHFELRLCEYICEYYILEHILEKTSPKASCKQGFGQLQRGQALIPWTQYLIHDLNIMMILLKSAEFSTSIVMLQHAEGPARTIDAGLPLVLS